MKINDVLNVLRKNLAGMGSSQDNVNESTLFGDFKHRVKVGGKVGFEILTFATVAGAETFGDNIAVLVDNADADFVKDELFVVVLDTVDDFSSRPEIENVSENLLAALEQCRLSSVGETVIVTPSLEIFCDYSFDVINWNGRCGNDRRRIFFWLASSRFPRRFLRRSFRAFLRRRDIGSNGRYYIVDCFVLTSDISGLNLRGSRDKRDLRRRFGFASGILRQSVRLNCERVKSLGIWSRLFVL